MYVLKNRFLRSSLGGLTLAINLASVAFATSFYQQPFSETVSDAPIIVKGTTGSHYTDWGKGDSSQKIYTYYQLQVEEILKGKMSTQPSVLIRELGGEKDGVALSVEGSSSFASGEKVVVLLSTANSEGSFDVFGMMLGKLNLEVDANGNEIIKGPALWNTSSIFSSEQSPRPWTLADLRRIIRKKPQEPEKKIASQTNEKIKQEQKEVPQPAKTTVKASVDQQSETQNQNSSESLTIVMIALIMGVLFVLWKILK